MSRIPHLWVRLGFNFLTHWELYSWLAKTGADPAWRAWLWPGSLPVETQTVFLEVCDLNHLSTGTSTSTSTSTKLVMVILISHYISTMSACWFFVFSFKTIALPECRSTAVILPVFLSSSQIRLFELGHVLHSHVVFHRRTCPCIFPSVCCCENITDGFRMSVH